jgi:sulfatase maturation enzyme AslB (radical SAM superfamily)
MTTDMQTSRDLLANEGDKISPTFCVFPFIALSTSPTGQVIPCCLEVPPIERTKLSAHIIMKNEGKPLLELINNEHHKAMRSQMLQGSRPKSCYRCWQTEDQGDRSYRVTQNKFLLREADIAGITANCTPDGTLLSFQPKIAELALGNKCNLKCKMCGSNSSTAWIKEDLDTGRINAETGNGFKDINWYKSASLKDAFANSLQKLEHLYIRGGEPLIIEEHEEILQACIEKNISKNVILKYATNLTHLPDHILETWKRFKCVNVLVSLEGVGELNEYIRYPSKWSAITGNLEKLKLWMKEANIEVGIISTFQIYNMIHFEKLLFWVFDQSNGASFSRIPAVSWVITPSYLDPHVAPLALKQLAHRKLMTALSHFSGKTNSHSDIYRIEQLKMRFNRLLLPVDPQRQKEQWKQFCVQNDKQDQYRKQRVFSVLPEFKEFWVHDDITNPPAATP